MRLAQDSRETSSLIGIAVPYPEDRFQDGAAFFAPPEMPEAKK